MPPAFSRFTAGLWAIGASLILVVVAAAVLDLRAQRQRAILDRCHSAAELAAVLAEDTSRYLRVVDLVLRDVQSYVADRSIATADQFREDLGDAATSRMLRAALRDLPETRAIGLHDATGELVSISSAWPAAHVSIGNLEFFRYLRDHDDTAAFLSEVERSPANGAPTLYLARRVNGPRGEFIGLVVAALDVAHLAGRYQAILSQSDESITLLRRDGLVLVRYPEAGVAPGQHVPRERHWYAAVAAGGGEYFAAAYLDGGPSAVAVKPVGEYGLVVNVAVAEAVALAAWRHQVVVVVAACGIITIGIAVLFGVIARQFRRLQRSAEALLVSERRLLDFAQTASEWFWEQDADLRFTRISLDAPQMRPGDLSHIGQTRWEWAHADLSEASWAVHKADLEARRPFRDFCYQRLGDDGRQRYVSVSGNPIHDSAGNFVGYRGTGRDITAAMEAAAELSRAKEQAEAASRAKSEFLASMTHELRTPLNAIIGFSELIRDQPFGPVGNRYVEYAREIHASGHHLLAEINNVLDMSRIEAGRYGLSDEAIDLGGLVTKCCATLMPQAEKGHVRLLREETLEGLVVRADLRAIRQVLLNVLDNAVKFTPAGGSVSVRAEIARDGGGLALVVTDTGIGIDNAALESLFEPFRQADSSITRRFGGTGLGLPISLRLMRLHGGALDLDGSPGKGTIVRISFPGERILAAPRTGTT
jgi:signal transduction histidine kinase